MKNLEMLDRKQYQGQGTADASHTNVRYTLLPSDNATLYRKFSRQHGVNVRNAPEHNLDNWLNPNSPDYKPVLRDAVFFYAARAAKGERLKVCIATPEMVEAAWKYGHHAQIVLDSTFGVCSVRMLLFITLGIDEEGKALLLFLQYTKKMDQSESQSAATPRLPPEVVSLVLQELDYDLVSLSSFSLASKSSRDLTLPFLFHHLCLPDGKIFQRGSRLLVFDAPHIRPYVREVLIGRLITAPGSQFDAELQLEIDQKRLERFFLVLPGLKVLHCFLDSHLAIPLASVDSTLTILYIRGNVPPASELLRLLQSVAGTLRHLTLQYMSCDRNAVSSNDPSTGSMLALERLSLCRCRNLPFSPTTIQMPNLKTLSVDDCDESIFACVPPSLETLLIQVLSIYSTQSLPEDKLLCVNNVVIWCYPVKSLIQRMLSKLCIPSKIKRLEIVLLLDDDIVGSDGLGNLASMRDDGFEDYILSLHQIGSLERLIVTSELDTEGVRSEFPRLSSLDILDVHSGTSSLLSPPCRRLAKTRDGSWGWTSE
ncbi:hypothetical protein EYR40_005987 [Pleurotus pulmonarius]|nr:hypothetical protein EYR40_005987 [Pleurotus pulmonarius]